MRPRVAAVVCFVAAWGGSAALDAQPVPDDPALKALLQDPRFAPPIIQAIEARHKGEVDEALDHLRQANNAVKRAKGSSHADQLPILDMAAEVLFEAGRLEDALTPLKRAVAIREALVASGDRGGHEVGIASTLLLMGRAHASTGRFETGFDALTRAVRLLDDSLGPGHEATSSARRELSAAVAIFETTLGSDHPATIRAKSEQVEVEISIGDHEGALRLLEAILEAERGRAGPATPGFMKLAVERAVAEQHAGRPEAAAARLEAALAEAAEAGAAVSTSALGLRALAEIRLADDDSQAAHDAAAQALGLDQQADAAGVVPALLDRLLLLFAGPPAATPGTAAAAAAQLARAAADAAGAQPVQAAEAMRLAARIALADGDDASAVALAAEALATDTRAGNAVQPAAFADRLLLAQGRLSSGNAAAALESLEAAHREARSEIGASHTVTLEIATAVAECQARLGKADEAERVLVAALSRHVPYAGRAAEARLVAVVDAVAAVLERQDSAARAEAVREALVESRATRVERESSLAAVTLAAFGRLRLAEHHWGEAIACYERTLAVQERCLDPNHPDVAATLVALGKSLRHARRHDEARVALARAASIWDVVVGPTHPIARETVKLLALSELSLDRPAAALPLMERLLAAYDADPAADQADVARLLMKMAEVHIARGDIGAARAIVGRALALQSASDTVLTAVDIADFAKRNRLADDDDGGLTIAGARQLADPTARGAADEIAVADAIREAWRLHSGGERDRARETLRERIGAAEAEGRRDTAAMADLLVALADMREAPLDVATAAAAYGRAAKIRRLVLGDAHPATIAVALRLTGVEIAAGDTETARSALGFADRAARALAVKAAATSPARVAAGQTAAIALAAGDHDLALEALEVEAALCGDGDPEAAVAVLTHLGGSPLVRSSAAARTLCTAVADGIERGNYADPRYTRALALARAALALADGRGGEAAAILGRLVTSEERSLASRDPRFAADLLRLAAARERAGAGSAADEPRDRGRRLADMCAAAAGSPGKGVAADTADGWIDLARVLVEAGDLDRAERVLKAGVSSLAGSATGSADAAARLTLELGELRLAGRPQQAARCFADSVRGFRGALGGGSGPAVVAAIRLAAAEQATAADHATAAK